MLSPSSPRRPRSGLSQGREDLRETPLSAPSDARLDPWQASDAAESSESSGSWLLGYSDLMTLLFTFFVMLFAYQKAMSAKAVESAAHVQRPAVTAQQMPVVVPAPTVEPTSPTTPDVKPVPVEPNPPGVSRWLSIAGAGNTLANDHPPTIQRPDLGPELSKDVDISESTGQVRLEISDGILFDAASAEMKPVAAAVLDRLAQWLRGQPGIIAVEGHTDDRPLAGGRYRSNWDLSAARAGSVTQALIERGIPASRLRAVGFADTQPRGDNATPEGRAKNRRVSLVVFVERTRGVKI